MSLKYNFAMQSPLGEASSLRSDNAPTFAGNFNLASFSFEDALTLFFPLQTTPLVDQWNDDDEDLDDDDGMDLDETEEEEEEIWEEELDVDEEDFELDEEEGADFDSFDEEEDFYDDEPEARGHRVEDRNPVPCNPAYAVEARMELL